MKQNPERFKQELIEFLCKLPDVQSVEQRKNFISLTGLQWLQQDIDWEGSTKKFFTGLLRLFAYVDRNNMLEFIEVLRTSSFVSPERREELTHLSENIYSLSFEQWNKIFSGGKENNQISVSLQMRNKRKTLYNLYNQLRKDLLQDIPPLSLPMTIRHDLTSAITSRTDPRQLEALPLGTTIIQAFDQLPSSQSSLIFMVC